MFVNTCTLTAVLCACLSIMIEQCMYKTAILRNTIGGQKTWEANPISFAISRNLHFIRLG